MTQTTITTTSADRPSQPASAKVKDAGRCTFAFPNRSRCRLQVQNPNSGLCGKHASALEPRDTDDLSMDLFGEAPVTKLPKLDTPEEISDFLTNVIVLLAQGRITPRRASVLTYASSLPMRGSIFMEQHTAPPEVIYDVRPDRTDDQETARPEEPSPVLTGATR
jgi:hypothetical protein